MSKILTKFLYLIILLGFVNLWSCSKDEEVRLPENILGVWKLSDTCYYEYSDDHRVHNLNIIYQDGLSYGTWSNDVYYYEPGYNLVIYLTPYRTAEIYQIIEMNRSRLTWCWVKTIDENDVAHMDNVGELIGTIIKEAQEGFTLHPELYQKFQRISEDEFLNIIDGLDVNYPY